MFDMAIGLKGIRGMDVIIFMVLLLLQEAVAGSGQNTNHTGGKDDSSETILLIPHSSISFGPSVHGRSPLSSGLMHILSSALFQPTLKLFGTAPLFSAALSEALGCVPPCTCKLDFITQESEMVCRGMIYPELLGAFMNASSSSRKTDLKYPSTQNPLTSPDEQAGDILVNDLWKRNRGRENRERTSPVPMHTIAPTPGPLQNSGDKQKNYYETAFIDGNGSKKKSPKFSSLTFTFNSIPILKRELFSALRHLDNSPNGLSAVRELYFYFNKIKAIDSDAFLDFEISEAEVRDYSSTHPKLNDMGVGVKRLKIIEHSWHTDPQDYFSGFPYIALSPLKHTLEDIQLSSPNIESVPIDKLSQFVKLKSLVVKSSGLKTFIGNASYNSYEPRLPLSLTAIHLSTDSMDRLPKFPGPALNVTYFTLTSTILKQLVKEDFINNLPFLKELFIPDSNLSIIAYNALYPLKNTLQTFNVRNNKISNLDVRTFIGLTQLRTLDLSGNELSTLSDGIFKDLHNLQTLFMKYNRIIQLGDVMGLEDRRLIRGGTLLTKIYLKSNSLTSLPTKLLKALPNIELLDLSKNRISQLPSTSFDFNKKLQILDLSANLLSSLDVGCFSGPAKTLFDLKLYHNHLSQINTNVLSNLENMTYIDLSYNNLSTLDVNLFRKSQDRLTYMDIAFNPWHCDCKMKEFRLWLESRITNLFFLHRFKARTILNRAKCESPLNLLGVPLSYPPLNAFICHSIQKSEIDGKHRATLISEIDTSQDPGYNFSANFNSGDGVDHEEDLSVSNIDGIGNTNDEISEGIIVDSDDHEYTNKELSAALFRQQTIDSMIMKEIKELSDTMLHLVNDGSESNNLTSHGGLETKSLPHSFNEINFLNEKTGPGYSSRIKEALKQTYGKSALDTRSNHVHLVKISIVLSTISIVLVVIILAHTLISTNKNSYLLHEGQQAYNSQRSALSKPTTALSNNGHNNGLHVESKENRENNGLSVDDNPTEYTSYNSKNLSRLCSTYAGGSTCSLASRTSLSSSKFNQWTSGYKKYLWRAPLIGSLFRPNSY